MGIYLSNMEMPEEGFVEILIHADGTVQQTGQSNRIGGADYYTPYVGEMPVMYKAIPVPPHGRLVDADALERDIERYHLSDGKYQHWVQVQQTIIPVEEEET